VAENISHGKYREHQGLTFSVVTYGQYSSTVVTVLKLSFIMEENEMREAKVCSRLSNPVDISHPPSSPPCLYYPFISAVVDHIKAP